MSLSESAPGGLGDGGGPRAILRKVGSWSLIVGGLLAVLGVAAMAAPWLAAATVATICGVMLIVGGASQLAMTAATFTWRGFWITLVTGLLGIVLGVTMLVLPAAAIGTLVIFLAVMLLLEASAKISAVFLVQGDFPWGWLLVDGLVTAALGIVLLVSRPAEAAMLLGIFVGINLLSSGIMLLAAGWSLRSRLDSSA